MRWWIPNLTQYWLYVSPLIFMQGLYVNTRQQSNLYTLIYLIELITFSILSFHQLQLDNTQTTSLLVTIARKLSSRSLTRVYNHGNEITTHQLLKVIMQVMIKYSIKDSWTGLLAKFTIDSSQTQLLLICTYSHYKLSKNEDLCSFGCNFGSVQYE